MVLEVSNWSGYDRLGTLIGMLWSFECLVTSCSGPAIVGQGSARIKFHE